MVIPNLSIQDLYPLKYKSSLPKYALTIQMVQSSFLTPTLHFCNPIILQKFLKLAQNKGT